MAIDKLKMYKASGPDEIPAELIKAGGENDLDDNNGQMMPGQMSPNFPHISLRVEIKEKSIRKLTLL